MSYMHPSWKRRAADPSLIFGGTEADEPEVTLAAEANVHYLDY